MLQIVFVWSLLIGTYILRRKAITEDKRINRLYIGFSSVVAIFAIALKFDGVLSGYTRFLTNVFSELTMVVIGR